MGILEGITGFLGINGSLEGIFASISLFSLDLGNFCTFFNFALLIFATKGYFEVSAGTFLSNKFENSFDLRIFKELLIVLILEDLIAVFGSFFRDFN